MKKGQEVMDKVVEKMGIYERDHDGALERQDQGVG